MIILGVTGSLAAYKAVEILRLLTKAGQEVHVLMTEAATRFVGPLTFQAISGHPVLTDTLDPKGWQMAHLDLPESASVMLVAPASANILAKLAMGLADNILTAAALAIPRTEKGKLKVPFFIAPAMHAGMWRHPATQANVKTLKGYGYQFIGPVRGPLGRQADEGTGRLEEPQLIVSKVLNVLAK
ncbi:MAG: flavoprotein [Elusimicrobiota bacterium]|jgi:phosphopantothenoylcysteine decarboxylase/phosphopantothenate--cysteine ligase